MLLGPVTGVALARTTGRWPGRQGGEAAALLHACAPVPRLVSSPWQWREAPRDHRRHQPPNALHGAAPKRRTQLAASAAPVPAQTEPYGAAAAKLRAFCDAFPEAPDEVVGVLLRNTPAVVTSPPEEVAAKLDGMCAALGISRLAALRLVARVPAAWARSADALAVKMDPLATKLKVPPSCVVELLTAQPALWNVNVTSIVSDRMEALGDKLGVRDMAALIELITRQPLLWVVPPAQIKNSLQQVGSMLGLDAGGASSLVVKMPVVLVMDPKLAAISIDGLAGTLGLPAPKLLQLVARSLGLCALPTGVVQAGMEALAAALGVGLEAVLELLMQQPTLLATSPANIKASLEVVSSSLNLNSEQALRVLIAQPALLYDVTRDTLVDRLEQLASTFGKSGDEMRSIAAEQPALLAIPAGVLASALATYRAQMQQGPAALLPLLLADPGMFVMYGSAKSALDTWADCLGLDQATVSRLLIKQPALLELTANTVKARLESLVALFNMPLQAAAGLVMKHPALGVIPPNATITRVKNWSVALDVGMQGAAGMLAKEPALLGLAPAELKPYAANVLEMEALFEFYSADWLQRQRKEAQPARSTSFAGMHSKAAGGKPSNWY